MQYTTSTSWQRREPIYRKFLRELPTAALLREAGMRWFEGLLHTPMWREDVLMLAILYQECETRGLAGAFAELEGKMRAELARQGLLPR